MTMLISKLFSKSSKLQNCAMNDIDHITLGARGEAVQLIQLALVVIENCVITKSELDNVLFGKSTEAAVLSYKTKRRIINRSYQNKPDAIVGKMTVAALDLEVFKSERTARSENFNKTRDALCD
jgi:hypothetical protein